MKSIKLYDPLPEKLLDFRLFLIMVWRTLGLPDPTPIQLDIAKYLQKGDRRKIIEAFRGVGKSWITSAYVMWRLRINPNLKFLVVSASKDRSSDFTTFCMRLITEVDVLNCMYPSREQRNSKISFDVSLATPDHSPSVKSVGIFGQLTGTRADEVIADDIETANNSLTQGIRDRLSEAVKEFEAILKPDGIITYLGTPQTEQSLYNQLPSRGYDITIWPARYPTEKQIDNYGNNLAPKILNDLNKAPYLVGTSTDKKRFSDMDLSERELSYGRSGFSLQFMLDTTLSDADRYPLKLSDLIILDLDLNIAPEKIVWGRTKEKRINELQSVGFGTDGYYEPEYVSTSQYIPYTQRIIVIDPSGRGKDETAYSVLYERDGYIFLMEAGGFNDGYGSKVLNALAEISLKHKINAVVVESNFGDGMFKALLTPVFISKGVKANINEVRNTTNKEARIIDTLEPVLNSHRLIVNRAVIERDFASVSGYPADVRHKYQLFYQLTHMTKEKGALAHDDRLDSLAMGVTYFLNSMKQDVDVKSKQRQNKSFEEELHFLLTGNIKQRSKEAIEAGFYTPTYCSVLTDKGIITAEFKNRNNRKRDIRDVMRNRH